MRGRGTKKGPAPALLVLAMPRGRPAARCCRAASTAKVTVIAHQADLQDMSQSTKRQRLLRLQSPEFPRITILAPSRHERLHAKLSPRLHRAARPGAARSTTQTPPSPRAAIPTACSSTYVRWHKRRATIWFDIHRQSPHTLISHRQHRDGSPRARTADTSRKRCAGLPRFHRSPSVGATTTGGSRPKVPIVVEAQGGHGKRNRDCRAGTEEEPCPLF